MWYLFFGSLFFVCSPQVLATDSPKFETLDQYTRLQLPVSTGTSFRLLNGASGEATLVVDRITPSALGELTAWSDSRVQQVKVKPVGLDKAEISIRFRDAKTESFAYLQGSNLVLDLWKQTGDRKSETTVVAPAAPAAIQTAIKSVSRRTLASAKPAAKVAPKVEKLAAKVEPLRLEHDLFQKFLFPMPELTIGVKGDAFPLPPKPEVDGKWNFAEGDKETEEGKAFELAKRLYHAKKYGLCLKTLEILKRDHSENEYLDEIAFLETLAYRKLGEVTSSVALVEKSERMLGELASKRDLGGEPLPFQGVIALYFAQKAYLLKDWPLAIQQFEAISARGKVNDPTYPYVQMLLAEAYAKVSQPRRAERLYRFLVEKFPKHILAKEAAYRIADLLALEKNYQRVSEEGEAALKAYPEFEHSRSEVIFHLGEANFWLKRFAKAEHYFRRYVNIASATTTASQGWVRIGELDEIVRSDLKAARENYLKAKNGYPFSKGDLVATVRLARIDLPREKDPAFVVKTLREMLADQTTEWELKRMAELTLAEYMLLTREVPQAIELSRSGMAQTDGQVYELYKRAYVRALYTQLTDFNTAKKYSDSLALYEREKKWIELYGPESLRAVAEIYRGLGLFASANSFMERYSVELRRAGGRGLASTTLDPALAKAKAENSFARGAYAETVSFLENFADARSQYMRAVSEFRQGHRREAFAAADKALAAAKADPGLFRDDMIENLADVQIERYTTDRDFRRMQEELEGCRDLLKKESERLTFGIADAIWYQKRHADAVKAYRTAIEKFPSSARVSRARYNLGMSYVSLGKREDAVRVLTELRDSGQSVWADSAKQELGLLEWEKKYSSVLRTLPPSGLGIAN